jgi:hypothetical protein
MNNKPVAWMSADGKFNKKETWLFPIPLYTHPVKEKHTTTLMESRAKIFQNEANKSHPVKELTDEEIMECERWVFLQERMRATNDSWNFTIELARAILRKAQEK